MLPCYLGAADHPWLTVLLEEYARFVGRPRRCWSERLCEPLPRHAPHRSVRMAAHVLDRLTVKPGRPSVRPRVVRRALFSVAPTAPTRAVAVERAAKGLGLDEERVERLMFADLPRERPLPDLLDDVTPSSLAERTNLALVQGLVFRSDALRVRMFGRTRPVIRQAKLNGLICQLRRPEVGDVEIEVSGPLSMFRRTLMYGRALAQLIPFLAWCDRFELQARCTVRDVVASLELGPRDPIFPGPPPKPFDSRVERAFARDFGRLTQDWEITREPEPLEVETTLVFPDFLLTPRRRSGAPWFVEIVGFWTPDYVARKLRRLRRAGLDNLILCIDRQRNCSDVDLPRGASVVRYERKIDAQVVLDIIDERASARTSRFQVEPS